MARIMVSPDLYEVKYLEWDGTLPIGHEMTLMHLSQEFTVGLEALRDFSEAEYVDYVQEYVSRAKDSLYSEIEKVSSDIYITEPILFVFEDNLRQVRRFQISGRITSPEMQWWREFFRYDSTNKLLDDAYKNNAQLERDRANLSVELSQAKDIIDKLFAGPQTIKELWWCIKAYVKSKFGK